MYFLVLSFVWVSLWLVIVVVVVVVVEDKNKEVNAIGKEASNFSSCVVILELSLQFQV